jgi:hypothetical protein
MCAVCLLVHGAVTDKKLLVQPITRISVLSVAVSAAAVNVDGVHSKVKENCSTL